jgi:hypothetical protein
MRSVSIILMLIQLCVQFSPLAVAEEIVDAPQEEQAQVPMVEEMPDVAGSVAESGAIIVPEASTGSILVPATLSGVVMGSGADIPVPEAIPISATGSIETPVVQVVIPPVSIPVRVVVSEVMWMGSNLSTADEWIEVAAFSSGSTSTPRSVSGWTLVSVKAGVETTLARLPDIALSSGSAIVIANNHASSSRLALEPAVVTAGMSVPNTQLLLRLKSASGTIVDEVDDGVGVPMAGANPSGGGPKASMERADPWSAGILLSSWKTATLTVGFDDGVPIFGTPGVLGVVQTPAPPFEQPPVVVVPPPVSVAPLLRLTEIMANPIGADTDEWIEIGSFEISSVDLSEVVLRIGTVRFGLSGVLEPGGHLGVGRIVSGLPLANGGATVELLWRDRVIDAWTYGEMVEGISIGRAVDGVVSPQCVPTPGMPNAGAASDPQIVVQSSSPSTAKLSLNLEAKVAAGSLAGASCSWTYPDGYASMSCNPPSHSMPGPLVGDVLLVFKDYCGNTVTRSLHVDIAGSPGKEPEQETSVCMPTAFTGVTVSEFVPNPSGDEEDGEWIELANPSADEKTLCGWSLDDSERGSRPYPLDRWRLGPGDRLVLPRSETDIALNNDADAVRLFAPLRQGGSGAYEIVRYVSSPEDRSWALRDDGVRLWTVEMTPGEPNTFPGVTWPKEVLARISGAMPNPAGADTAEGEWVEIENLTPYPMPFTGWMIESTSTSFALENIILGPRERHRIEASGLANAEGVARLIDRDGVVHSALAWKNAKDETEVSQQKPVAHVSDLSLLQSDDCMTWKALDADDHVVMVRLSGIVIDNKEKCIDYVSVLHENKKIDQHIYSLSGGSSSLFIGGTDIASLLLREGLAFVDRDHPLPFVHAYEFDEREARDARRGVWADAERIALIDEARAMDEARNILSAEGLTIIPSLKSGIVQAGDVLEIETNVPSSVSIAFGSGSPVPYAGPIVVDGDREVWILAESDVQTASGYRVIANSFQSYHIIKSRYPRLLVSEVYPSPAKGENEWIELFNPTDEKISLVGWSIDDVADAGSKPDLFGVGDALLPGERKIFTGSTVAWNNGGDSVRLIDPRGHVSHVIAYGSVKMGRAVAVSIGLRGDVLGQCPTVHATPGGENRCADEPPKLAKKKKTSGLASRSASHALRYVNLVPFVESHQPERGIFQALRQAPLSSSRFVFWPYLGIFLFIVTSVYMLRSVRSP